MALCAGHCLGIFLSRGALLTPLGALSALKLVLLRAENQSESILALAFTILLLTILWADAGSIRPLDKAMLALASQFDRINRIWIRNKLFLFIFLLSEAASADSIIFITLTSSRANDLV